MDVHHRACDILREKMMLFQFREGATNSPVTNQLRFFTGCLSSSSKRFCTSEQGAIIWFVLPILALHGGGL